MRVETLVRHATTEELRVIGAVIQRVAEQPAVVVTVEEGGGRRRYVVAEEDAHLFEGLKGATPEAIAQARGWLMPFGCQWLRGVGRVDEMYRSLSMGDVVKVELIDRERVWGR